MADEIEEMEDISNIVDEAEAPKGVENSADAASSPAPDVSKPEDSLSIVRNVVEEREEADPAAASSADSGEDGSDTAEPSTQNEQETEAKYADVPFHKHPRFREVLGELKTAKIDAERYQNVVGFLDQIQLNGQEASDLLVVGGLMKTDPAKAINEIAPRMETLMRAVGDEDAAELIKGAGLYKVNPTEALRVMKPVMKRLLEATGEMLPDDLRARFNSGELPLDAALELSRARAQRQFAEKRQSSDAEAQEQQRLAEASLERQAIVAEWEDDRKKRDPHFAEKELLIEEEVKRLQGTGWRPMNAEGIQMQLKTAYDAVNLRFKPPAQQPAKPTIRPVNGAGQVSGNARPAPTSTLGIIENVVSKRQAG